MSQMPAGLFCSSLCCVFAFQKQEKRGEKQLSRGPAAAACLSSRALLAVIAIKTYFKVHS
jgi:hypothetical protein